MARGGRRQCEVQGRRHHQRRRRLRLHDQGRRRGGDKLDEAIIAYIRRNHNLLVGEGSAERIKKEIGSACVPPDGDGGIMEIKGRDLIGGIPKTIKVTSTEIREALQEPIQAICDALKHSLEQTPPELAADIKDRGIVLTGGGARCEGTRELCEEVFDLPTHRRHLPRSRVWTRSPGSASSWLSSRHWWRWRERGARRSPMRVPVAAMEMHPVASLSPRKIKRPSIAVLTPGIYNSAYFEHSYLAQQMGVELVSGSDLVVGEDDCVYMRTISGRSRVDVIYRRVDDLFLDPEVFMPDSMLGVPGIMRAWSKGNVAIANAPGAGVADDKVVYAFVPRLIKYYLDQDPIIPNVPTYLCLDKKERDYVIENLDKLVVKPANESGGYGMLVGPHATREEHDEFRRLLNAEPRNYIAQPTLSLSTAPTLCDGSLAPRHLDLRPFVLQGQDLAVTAGGLTRVRCSTTSTCVTGPRVCRVPSTSATTWTATGTCTSVATTGFAGILCATRPATSARC